MAIGQPMTREEYEKKFGIKPFADTPVASIKEQPQEGLLKSAVKGIAKGVLKTPARLATNLVQGAQGFLGKEKTQPFSGGFLGEVKPVGMEGSFGQKVKESVGAGLELSSNIPAIGGSAKIATGLAKGVVGGAVKQGVKAGATAGALQGVGSGLQENQSALQTGIEGAGGALAGGLLGGAFGGVSTLAANRLAKVGALPKRNQELLRDEARQLVTPHVKTLSTAEKVAAGEQGRITSPTLFKPGQVKISDREKEVADSVVGLVRKKNPLEKNVSNLAKEIENKSRNIDTMMEKEVVNPIKYDQLQSAIENVKADSQFLFTSDPTSEKAYDSVVELFKKNLVNNNFNLIKARREFDAEINSKFPNLLSKIGKGEMGDNARIWAVQDIRTMGNDLAEQTLPAGNTLKSDLRYITNLYRARKSMAKNELVKLNQSDWERFWDSSKGRALKALLLTGGTLAIGKTVTAGGE